MISIREQRGSERIISRVAERFFFPSSPFAVQKPNERCGKGREEQNSEEE